RDVERRHRLVRDHHRWIPREGAGNPDTLLLTPGELTRSPKVEVPWQLDGVEERQHPLADLRLVRLDAELLDHPGDLRADAVAGVQRVERVLEHHLQGADLLRRAAADRGLRDVLPVVADLAAGGGLEPDQHLGERRLPAARLPDDGDRLATSRVEV